MRPIFMILTAMLAVGMSVARVDGMAQAAAGSGQETTLAKLRDRYRVLLVFCSSADEERAKEQLRQMQTHAEAAHERDLVTIVVPANGPGGAETRLSDDDAAAARRRFQVADDAFAVVLVGKDGGEKLRSGKPIPFARLEATIDAMPMRKQEMKERGRQ